MQPTPLSTPGLAADDEQRCDQRRPLGGCDVLGNQVGDAARMIFIGAHGGGQDRRVKMPMPQVPRSCKNHGTDAKIVARRLAELKSDAEYDAALSAFVSWLDASILVDFYRNPIIYILFFI